MATFKAETKIDPFRLNYAKPRNYDVKIIGGKKVLIWHEEEPKKKREVFVVGADNLKNKSHLVPTAQEKRPASSESIKSPTKQLISRFNTTNKTVNSSVAQVFLSGFACEDCLRP